MKTAENTGTKFVLHGRAHVVHRNAKGEILWEGNDLENVFHDGGAQWLLKMALSEEVAPLGAGTFYLRLDARGAVAQTDTLAQVSGEPAGTYAAKAVASSVAGWTIALVGSYYRATSASVVWTCTVAAWTAVTRLFLATSSDGTGVLISTVNLTASRTLQVGDTLTADIYLTFAAAA